MPLLLTLYYRAASKWQSAFVHPLKSLSHSFPTQSPTTKQPSCWGADWEKNHKQNFGWKRSLICAKWFKLQIIKVILVFFKSSLILFVCERLCGAHSCNHLLLKKKEKNRVDFFFNPRPSTIALLGKVAQWGGEHLQAVFPLHNTWNDQRVCLLRCIYIYLSVSLHSQWKRLETATRQQTRTPSNHPFQWTWVTTFITALPIPQIALILLCHSPIIIGF